MHHASIPFIRNYPAFLRNMKKAGEWLLCKQNKPQE
jgi:hypothetical protein